MNCYSTIFTLVNEWKTTNFKGRGRGRRGIDWPEMTQSLGLEATGPESQPKRPINVVQTAANDDLDSARCNLSQAGLSAHWLIRNQDVEPGTSGM